jgi:DNA-directed RNA polymerase subunit RPC12/RpoP
MKKSADYVICPHCGYKDPLTTRYHQGGPYRCRECWGVFWYQREFRPYHITTPFNPEDVGGLEKMREALKK